MLDSADIYFIQHFADIYFIKPVCISVCWGYQVSRTYCQVSCVSAQTVNTLSHSGWANIKTRKRKLLLELSLDLFNTLKICCRHIEDLHEEVWCWKTIFWQNYRVFKPFFDLAPSKWCLIVYTLWNQLLLELSLDLFNTLKICCRHIEDVHEEVCCRNTFWQTYRVFNWQLHLVNNGW